MFDDGWQRTLAGLPPHPRRRAALRRLCPPARELRRPLQPRRAPFMVEPYFQVEIEPGTTLFGRLDRLDEEPDGTLHIIDYKGGSLTGDVDPGQLTFYAILVEEKLGRTVSRPRSGTSTTPPPGPPISQRRQAPGPRAITGNRPRDGRARRSFRQQSATIAPTARSSSPVTSTPRSSPASNPDMPIYEFRCNACRRRTSVFVRSVNSPVTGACEHCGSPTSPA